MRKKQQNTTRMKEKNNKTTTSYPTHFMYCIIWYDTVVKTITQIQLCREKSVSVVK